MAHGYGKCRGYRPVTSGVRYINAPLKVVVYIVIAIVDIPRAIVMMMYYHGPVTTITVVVMNVHVASPVVMVVVTIPVVVMVSPIVAVTVVMVTIVVPVVAMSFMSPLSSTSLRHCIH